MKSVSRFIVFAAMGLILSAGTDLAQAKCCPNPIKETIDKTPSIKEMQSKSARKLCYVNDALGNEVPNQTENSGKQRLGQ